MSKKTLMVIKVDITDLTHDQAEQLRIEMEVQTEDYEAEYKTTYETVES